MRIALICASALVLAACGAEPSVTAAPEASPAPEAAPEASATDDVVEFASSGTYTIDPGHTSLVFQVPHMGLSNYTARFTGIEATLGFHPEDAALTSLEVSVDPTSVATNYVGDYKGTHKKSGYESWNEDVAMDAKWMNAGEHPTITYSATNITKTGASTADVTGDLTFLGVTKPVTLAVTYNGGMDMRGTEKIGFSATGTVKRSEFGMGAYLPNIGDDISLVIETEFAKTGE